jgi:hypothetical protein
MSATIDNNRLFFESCRIYSGGKVRLNGWTAGKYDPATDSGMSIHVRSGFGYPMDLCHAVSDAGKYWRISESVAILVRALWKRWRMFRRLRWDSRDSVLVVLPVSPVVTSVAWEK